MAVRIRMTRMGRRNRACFRIGAYDSRTRRDGRCLESLGSYDPAAASDDRKLQLKDERVRHWLAHGALPTDKVAVLLKSRGLYGAKAAPAAAAAEAPKAPAD